MMERMKFEHELKKLNKQQRKAVEATQGPVMVIAGPGTGKTQILTLRIANILQKTDTPPESILALTFTESAATEMRKRLLEMIGAVAYRVSIKTIHGFCNEVIQNYPDAFPMIAGEQSLSEVEQIQLVRAMLETSRQRFARDIVSSISELKREGFSPKDVAEYEELSQLYAAYQKQLQRTGRYDYDDMVLSVAQVLRKNRNLRLSLQEQYLYILVDEHQDTNQSQNEVIELLAGDDSPNIFVVGDAKQAIYRFQGARLENFSYFKKRFKRAAVIALTENYRSTQTILDGALDIALHKEPLKSNVKHPRIHIGIAACATSTTEPYVVARHIQERISPAKGGQGGVKPEDIAVLYRTHKEGVALARWLAKLGVATSVAAGDDAFSAPDVKKLIILLEAVEGFGADYALVPALYLDMFSVAPLDVAILIDAARGERRTVFSLVRDKRILEKIIPHSAAAVFALYQQLSLWKALSKNFSLMPMFEEVVRRTGLISAGSALFSELRDLIARRRSTTLEDFLAHLEVMRDHRVGMKLQVASDKSQGVQLMTAHKAKGLEFDYVYIVGATANQWEARRSRNVFRFIKQGKDEESERNLLYVALTRARKEAIISYAVASADGKEQFVSAFVESIRPELKKEVSIEAFEQELLQHPEVEFKEAVLAAPEKEKEFFRKRFLEKGLSVSALNNYLECPTKFYFLNMVGLSEAPNAKAQAGNAAHGALKYAVESICHPREGGDPVSRKDFLSRFAFLLSGEPMREIDYKEALKKGERALSAYYDANHKTWNANMKPEFPIDGVKIDDIPVRGRLDRIDILDDGRVRVIDYKFKKPMTRNEILGKTKNSDGNYYRQLTFYKLLIEKGTKWKMQDAILDFLEPDAKSRFKQEVFAPSAEEVKELEVLIKKVSKEILTGEPWIKSCGESDCKYCELRKLMN